MDVRLEAGEPLRVCFHQGPTTPASLPLHVGFDCQGHQNPVPRERMWHVQWETHNQQKVCVSNNNIFKSQIVWRKNTEGSCIYRQGPHLQLNNCSKAFQEKKGVQKFLVRRPWRDSRALTIKGDKPESHRVCRVGDKQ